MKAREVAEKLGISIPCLWNYETGRRDVPNSIVRKYDKISGGKVTSDDLHAARQAWKRNKARKQAAAAA